MKRYGWGGMPLVLGIVMAAAAVPAFAAGLERIAEVGDVTATARPLNPGDEKAPTLDFDIVMDTHAGSLPLDMREIATIRGPLGTAITASAWKGGKGGHHIEGTLSFPSGSLRSVAPLTVTLHGEGGNDLVFVWKEALSGAPEGSPVSVDGGNYLNVTPATLSALLARKDFFFVNVHIPYEGEIAQTDAFLPYDQTLVKLARYPADKSAKIVLYCRSGRMSDVAARVLVKQGYTNVLNLDGGMIEWETSGYTLKPTQGGRS